ncbi:hypothetical protein TD95_004673 [Thielaviopsis punctulata]|uniref:Uncharacterized protein n=1 Tax=Thielaviopsis punctulata TaxID=72032 RepID=A0A0F4ZFP5_9PEZI|nr:hypothetical protein TD95_004673 [Thielaviopsis punctulata]
MTPGDSFPGGSIALGIVVGILSTSIQSIGLTLQRKSHILEDAKAAIVRRPPHLRRRWQLGMAMFIAANILGSSVQISTLPLPVLSTLQASGLVFNGLCATLILAEPFTRLSLVGTVLVCLGALLIAIFGAIPAPTHNLPELLELMRRRAFVVWMASTAVVVLFVAVTTDLLVVLVSRSPRLRDQNPRFRLMRGLAYGCISGVLSAHSLLVAKSAVELVIKTVIDGDNQFVHWQSWGAVGALISLALIQLTYLHRGLKLVSTSVLYPLVFCVYNIIAILDGLIYFEQADSISTAHAALITIGTGILLSGVLALSWRLTNEGAAGQSASAQPSPTSALGFIDDTEEEESLLGADSLSASPLHSPSAVLDRALMSPSGAYHTFAPHTSSSSYAEIWDELNDAPPSPGPLLSVDERSSLLSRARDDARRRLRRATTTGRRKSSAASLAAAGDGAAGGAGRQLQDAVGGLFKMRWFSRDGVKPDRHGRRQASVVLPTSMPTPGGAGEESAPIERLV